MHPMVTAAGTTMPDVLMQAGQREHVSGAHAAAGQPVAQPGRGQR